MKYNYVPELLSKLWQNLYFISFPELSITEKVFNTSDSLLGFTLYLVKNLEYMHSSKFAEVYLLYNINHFSLKEYNL